MNKRSERAKFNRLFQQPGESVKEFSVRLQQAAQTCMFGDYLEKNSTGQSSRYIRWALDDQLTDQFIIGIRAESIRQTLINKDPKDFQACYQLAVDMEMSDRESKKFTNLVCTVYNDNHLVKKKPVNIHGPRSQSGFSGSHENKWGSCPHCARRHDPAKCPAKNWQCLVCKKTGNTSRVCTQNKKHNIRSIRSINDQNAALIWNLNVQNVSLDMEVDTGACSSVIPVAKYHQFFHCLTIKPFFFLYKIKLLAVKIRLSTMQLIVPQCLWIKLHLILKKYLNMIFQI